MLKITPFLWFDTQAEEAARFYVSLFPNSRLGKISRYGEAGHRLLPRRILVALTVALAASTAEACSFLLCLYTSEA